MNWNISDIEIEIKLPAKYRVNVVFKGGGSERTFSTHEAAVRYIDDSLKYGLCFNLQTGETLKLDSSQVKSINIEVVGQ